MLSKGSFFNYHTVLRSSLKTLDTIGNCQRTVFSLGVSQHMHKITNLYKFVNSIGRRSCEIIMKERNTLVTRSCVLSVAWFRDLKINLKFLVENLSRKLRYFRGSRFWQCFILSTALHCLLPRSKFCINATGILSPITYFQVLFIPPIVDCFIIIKK